MYEYIPEIYIWVPIAGQYVFYQVPHDRYMRPISIGGTYTGTFNLDAFLAYQFGNFINSGYLDATQNRGSPYGFHCPPNGWMNPGDNIRFVVTNHTLAGQVNIQMWAEFASREQTVPQNVNIVDSVELDTRPFGRLFG